MTKEEETYPYQRIYERDNFKCRYCGWDGLKNFESWFTANFNIDHIRPQRLRRNDDDSNLVLACRACNLYKGQVDCYSFEEALNLVNRKRAEAEKWYRKHVLKLDS